MGTIWIEGDYKTIHLELLNDYVTKEQLDNTVLDLTDSIEKIDHEVINETLIIS